MDTTIQIEQIVKETIQALGEKISKLYLPDSVKNAIMLSIVSDIFAHTFTIATVQLDIKVAQKLLDVTIAHIQEKIPEQRTDFHSFLEKAGVIKTGESEVTVEI